MPSRGTPIVRSESALGDFGGDYGNYLQLLEGDTALGFNPQSDPISDNQVHKIFTRCLKKSLKVKEMS